MRLFLLPISTRRTLLYCERLLPQQQLQAPTGGQAQADVDKAAPTQTQMQTQTQSQSQTDTQTDTQTKLQPQPQPQLQERESLVDKAQDRAARLWAGWEKKPAGSWQRRVVAYGNAGFRRITFEEWGLKSVPPLTRQQRLSVTGDGAGEGARASSPSASAPRTVEVVFPPSIIPPGSVAGLLHRLSTERESLHRQRLLWCLVGMPITAPIAILPVVPNIPFFYLVYRAWSHWRAISGGKHIQFLLQHNRLNLSPSSTLDAVYANEKTKMATAAPEHQREGSKEAEELLLSNPEGGKAVADTMDSPQLELELERAIWQIETAIAKEKREATEGRPTESVRSETATPEANIGGDPEKGTKEKEKSEKNELP